MLRHGPKPDSHEAEAEAFTKLEAEAEALTLNNSNNRSKINFTQTLAGAKLHKYSGTRELIWTYSTSVFLALAARLLVFSQLVLKRGV